MSTATLLHDNDHVAAPTNSKALHITLWVVQALLAVMFLMAGLMKLTTPIADLQTKMGILAQHEALLRFIGFSETMGGLGMILPSLSRLQPKLTALAGLGLFVVMVLAVAFHLYFGAPGVVAPAILGVLAAFVAWGRWKGAPIAPRGE